MEHTDTVIQNLLNKKSNNLYVYTKIDISTQTGFSMNVNSTISSEILTNIISFINKLNTKNVILVCRSSNIYRNGYNCD